MWSGNPLRLHLSHVRSETLKKRFNTLGLTYYELARRVAELRSTYYGDEIKNFRSLTSAVQKAIEQPHKASGKTLDTIIMAMGGEIYVRWQTEKIVVDISTEGLSSNSNSSDQSDNHGDHESPKVSEN